METSTAVVRTTENSRNSRPTNPPMNRMGVNTATSEMEMETTVKPTSRAPRRAARRGVSPISSRRTIFSSTTMASSTTKPVETVRAMRERLSRLYPHKYMTPKVASKDTGAATAGMAVALPLRKNRNVTSTTRAMESARLFSTSRSEARMVSERSSLCPRSALSGSHERNCGSISFT